jgi:nucleotide-binding universal stress UspA family protein
MIVVGVDGSESARAALGFALDEARLRGAAVRVVGVWHVPVTAYGGAMVAPDPSLVGDLEPQMSRVLERALEDAGDAAAGLEVEKVVREGAPVAVLLEEAQDAELLVVGSRGLGGFRGLLLGSVSQQCSHHAPCPVVIVRHARDLPSGG